MKISLDLTDDQEAMLERALASPRFKSCEELTQAWLPLAIEAWLGWLSGEKRYNSLTEQYTDWIEQIYTRLLPESEAPSAERLYNSFNVPYGQAQYIARVLNNRALACWREHALEQLKAALRERKAEVYAWIEQEREMAVVELVLFLPAGTELEIIVENLFRESPGEVDIPRSTVSRDLVAVRITARTFEKVCESLNV